MLTRLGLQKTTLVDFPGRVAATLFTHGCSLRCPFCHNPELVAGPVPESFLSREEISAFLEHRSARIEGVCISGGEPLLHQDLGDLMREVQSHGLAVKLDTAGVYPDHLARLLDAGLVDYVAIDVKTAPDNYRRVSADGGEFLRSLAILRESGVAYELRTTVAPGVVTYEDIVAIAEMLRPGELYYLVQFRPGNTLDPLQAETTPYSPTQLAEWQKTIANTGTDCRLRGVA